MSVKNEWPTANINFAVVIQKSVVIFLCRAIFLAATVDAYIIQKFLFWTAS